MKAFRTRKSVWIPCACAGIAVWVAQGVQPSTALLVAAVLVTAACTTAVIWTICADRAAARASAEQAQLFWHAVESELPDPVPQSADEWIARLGARAAAQAESAETAQRDTARFLTQWNTQVTATVEALCDGAERVRQSVPTEGRLLTQACNTLRCRTEQLMRFFHCEADCTLRRIRPVALSRVVSDAIIHQSEQLRTRRIGLRQSMTRLCTESDPVLLTAALDELLDNAVRHTPPGGTVGLTCRLVNGCAEIAVEDAGCGISPAEMGRIFDRGFVGRGEPLGRAGLGLFIARAYCELLGHTLTVTSVEGKGTRAVIRMACTQATQSAQQ